MKWWTVEKRSIWVLSFVSICTLMSRKISLYLKTQTCSFWVDPFKPLFSILLIVCSRHMSNSVFSTCTVEYQKPTHGFESPAPYLTASLAHCVSWRLLFNTSISKSSAKNATLFFHLEKTAIVKLLNNNVFIHALCQELEEMVWMNIRLHWKVAIWQYITFSKLLYLRSFSLFNRLELYF